MLDNCKVPTKEQESGFNDLVAILGTGIAQTAFNRNNGNLLDKTPYGEDSILYKKLTQFMGPRAAIHAKAEIYKENFLKHFGDWTPSEESLETGQREIPNVTGEVNEQGEPELYWVGSRVSSIEYDRALNVYSDYPTANSKHAYALPVYKINPNNVYPALNTDDYHFAHKEFEDIFLSDISEEGALKGLVNAKVINKQKYAGRRFIKKTPPDLQGQPTEEQMAFNVRMNKNKIDLINRAYAAFGKLFHYEKMGKSVAVEVNLHTLRNIQKRFGVQDSRIQTKPEKLSVAERKIEYLKKVFPDTEVYFDESLEVAGRIIDGVIYLNPNALFTDTVTHEFAHLMIDLAGGMKDALMRAGVNQLQDTALWKEVAINYPELSGESLQKEVLATAIGRQSAEFMAQPKWRQWLNKFFSRIARLLGIQQDTIKEASLNMLRGNFSTNGTPLGTYDSRISIYAENLAKKEEAVDNALKAVTRRAKVMKHNIDNPHAHSHTTEYYKETQAKFENAQNQMAEADSAKAILIYVRAAHTQLTELNNKFSKVSTKEGFDLGSDPYRVLDEMKKYLGAYEHLDTVQYALRSDEELKKQITTGLEDLQTTVDDLIGLRESLKKLRLDVAKQVIAEAGHSGRITFKEKLKFELEFNQNIQEGLEKKLSDMSKARRRRRIDDERRAYVAKKYAENYQQIREKELAYHLDILTKAEDISSLTAMVEDPQSINDDMIQTAREWVDDAEFKTMAATVALIPQIQELEEDLKKLGVKSGNQETQFSFMIEDGYIVTEYSPKFIEAKKKAFKEYNDLIKEEADEVEIEAARKRANAWVRKQLTQSGNLIDKWKSEKWKALTPEQKKFVKKVHQIIDTQDTLVYKRGRLGRVLNNTTFYKLPSVEKNTFERLREGGLWESIKQKARDTFGKAATDIGYAHATEVENDEPELNAQFARTVGKLANESNEPLKSVPLYFRGKANDQSNDLFTLLLLNEWNSKNFHEKSKIQPKIEILLDLMENRETYAKDASGKTIVDNLSKSLLGNKATISNTAMTEKETSNAAKVLAKYIDKKIYGINYEGSRSLNKTMDTITRWASSTLMIFNYFSAGTTALQAQSMNLVAAIGGDKINLHNMKKAYALYGGKILSTASDTTREVPKSFVNKLIEKYNALNNWSAFNYKFSNQTAGRQVLDQSNLYSMTNGAEHFGQAITMLARLDNIKITDKSGNLILDKKGNAVSLLDKHLEQWKKDKSINVNIESTNLGHKNEAAISRDIRELNQQLQGHYAKEEMFQRYWYGRMVGSLRGWLVRGLKFRFRGVMEGFKKEPQGLYDRDNAYFNRATQQMEEGIYTSFILYMRQLIKAIGEGGFSVALLRSNWKELSNYQKANIKRTIAEGAAISLLLLISQALMGLIGDDDDDGLATAMAFYTKRAGLEMFSYISPLTMYSILKSPAAGLTLFERAGSFTAHMAGTALLPFTNTTFEEYDTYESGSLSGKSKTYYKASKLIPGLYMAERSFDKSLSYLSLLQ